MLAWVRRFPVASVLLWVACGGLPRGPGAEDLDTGAECFVLEAALPLRDSMVIRIPHARCGPLRLTLAGAPRTGELPLGEEITLRPDHTWRPWEIQVRLVNEGANPVSVPIEMRVDSANLIQRGRRLNSRYRRPYVDFPLWDGQEMQQPWRFRPPGEASATMAPGERTAPSSIKLRTHGLTQGFRLAFEVRGISPARARRPPAGPIPPRPDTLPLGQAAERLIAAAGFPHLRARHGLFRQPDRGLLAFRVLYGVPREVYSSATGLVFAGRAGWIALHDLEGDSAMIARVRRDWFEPRADDDYLFSIALADTLVALRGIHDSAVRAPILRLVLGSPHAPSRLLVHLARSLYPQVHQPLAGLLAEAPAARSDPWVLTLLATLPNGGPPYEGARRLAREALRELAPSVARDPDAHETTLFVLAQVLEPHRGDSLLIRTLADHPRVRDNLAILTVLSAHDPETRERVLASVRAPARVKELLADYLGGGWILQHEEDPGEDLLRDPEAMSNLDVLEVLANAPGSSYDVRWTASRRLPEHALRRWEPLYVPPVPVPKKSSSGLRHRTGRRRLRRSRHPRRSVRTPAPPMLRIPGLEESLTVRSRQS